MSMRKVLYKQWIPKKIYSQNDHRTAPGTACMSDFIHKGTFLAWGIDYDQMGRDDQIVGHYTVALIEDEEGLVLPMNVHHIKFIND